MEEKILQYLGAFEQAATDFGPQAVDLALAYARVQSIGYLLMGTIFFVLFMFFMSYAVKLFRQSTTAGTWVPEDRWESASMGFAMAACVSAFPAAINLLYIWNWIGAFYPELRLVHQVIGGS